MPAETQCDLLSLLIGELLRNGHEITLQFNSTNLKLKSNDDLSEVGVENYILSEAEATALLESEGLSASFLFGGSHLISESDLVRLICKVFIASGVEDIFCETSSSRAFTFVS
ncbi:hypothetical protein MK805_11700 [Shimazuella sp. AN120528]|uniref:hypothetical protein n=1 Tax=Shimazuella soli TaxID=1892854 RepID=UPI001F0FEC23|nr:hypothetical protein [Shimazuella soli]MCH5585608.1 hypothetical protein [Shimazuella soli]